MTQQILDDLKHIIEITSGIEKIFINGETSENDSLISIYLAFDENKYNFDRRAIQVNKVVTFLSDKYDTWDLTLAGFCVIPISSIDNVSDEPDMMLVYDISRGGFLE